MRILNLVSYFTLLASLIFIVVVSFWAIYPYDITDFKNSPFPVNSKVVKQGDEISYTVNYCKHLPMESFVTRQFVDDILFAVPGIYTNVSTGCHIQDASLMIPKTLPVGKYHVNLSYSYHPNPIRTITISARTEDFEVVE